jgi:hypothetical protein
MGNNVPRRVIYLSYPGYRAYLLLREHFPDSIVFSMWSFLMRNCNGPTTRIEEIPLDITN